MHTSNEKLVRIAGLLNEVFTIQSPYSVEGLELYYTDNSVRIAAVGSVDDGTTLSWNYALAPQALQGNSGKTAALGLGVGLAVLPTARCCDV